MIRSIHSNAHLTAFLHFKAAVQVNICLVCGLRPFGEIQPILKRREIVFVVMLACQLLPESGANVTLANGTANVKVSIRQPQQQ